MEDNKQEELEDISGALDFEDDFFEEVSTKKPEEETAEDPEEDLEEEEEEIVSKEEESEEEEEEEEDYLTDEEIIEKYGEDVDPAVVRHYDVTKDYLLVDEDFEFTGSNLTEAYEQDERNRTEAVKERILDWLPEKAKVLLSDVIENSGEISDDTLTMILENRIKSTLDDYDPSDEDSMRSFIRAELVKNGQGDEADDLLDIYEEKGKLEKVAEQFKEKRDKLRAEEEKARIDQEIEDKRIAREQEQERLNSIKQVLAESKYSKDLSNKIINTVYGKSPEGTSTNLIYKLKQIYTDPNALVVLADLVSNYDPKHKTWDLDSFEKNIETKTTKKFKSSIEKKISGNNASKIKSSKVARKNSIGWDEVEI